MKKLLLPIFIACHCTAFTQAIQWQRCYGGSYYDYIRTIQQTTDSGYIAAGITGSIDGDLAGLADTNAWIIKLSPMGAIQWQKLYGGSNAAEVVAIQQTTDGGYIAACVTYSNDGDVTGAHGKLDYWVLKLSATGSLQWQKALGGSENDEATDIKQTPDGGYIVVGYTRSFDGDVTGHYGSLPDTDGWVVKLSAAGSVEWQKCYGGSAKDEIYAISLTNDSGYFMTGNTNSWDNGVTGVHGSRGNEDCWILRLSDTGVVLWQKCFGGIKIDEAYNVQSTSDGGCIFVAQVYSNDGDITSAIDTSSENCWVVKLSPSGTIQWEKSFGGSADDAINSIFLTDDDGYIFAGGTYSQDGTVGVHQGGVWMFKLSSSGTFLWQKLFGGATIPAESAVEVQQTFDGGYIMGANTNSTDGDITYNHGATDGWIVKLGDNVGVEEVTKQEALTIVPNPAKGSFTFLLSALGNEPVNVVVTNMLGIKVHQFTATTNQQQQVAMPFPSGIYFITATTQSGTKTASKIVVQ